MSQAAAEAIVKGGFAVAGQLCISVQRVLAHRSILAALQSEIVDRVGRLVTGDPMDERTDVGPLIDGGACTRVSGLVQEAVQSGARILAGGQAIHGNLFAPTVLCDVAPGSRLAIEEAFAPLVTLTLFDSLRRGHRDRERHSLRAERGRLHRQSGGGAAVRARNRRRLRHDKQAFPPSGPT